MTEQRQPNQEIRSDHGTVLVLALVFLLVMGLIALATAGLAVGAGANTSNARALSISQANAESEVSLVMADARSNYEFQGCSADSCYANPGFSSPDNCTPSSGGYSNLQVVCEGSGGNGLPTRTVDFYVCSASISQTACVATTPANFVLHAEVTFLDLPPGEATTDSQCNSSTSATCGLTATINFWDVGLADV